MEFQEKSLELNITRELLNLTDTWYWFLTDIPLWRYWRPRHRLPFLKHRKSSAGGFHITTEGKDDSTGEAGGGYDVRIKTGLGNYLLFIQYKKGELLTKIPNPQSEFAKAPHDHFKFKINSTNTNQHFTLRHLANYIGSKKGNAVVYAFPLIADMNDLEENTGRLLRKTKFVSIADIDLQAKVNNVIITRGQEHNFRIGLSDMNRCEINFFFFFFHGRDRTAEIIADIIALSFQKTLSYYISDIDKNYKRYDLYDGYIPEGLQQSFVQYLRYLLHYFEVSPSTVDISFFHGYLDYFYLDEFSEYQNLKRDVEIISAVFNALEIFTEFIETLKINIGNKELIEIPIPNYEPNFLIPVKSDGIQISFTAQDLQEVVEDITYFVI